jgi:hypothetical protein
MSKTFKKINTKSKSIYGKKRPKSKSISLKNKKTRKIKTKIKTPYSKDDYNSSDGMLTSVWGPSLWHYLHTMSFNYPNQPTEENKKYYKQFILNLVHVLPCKYCRENLRKNFKTLPLTDKNMKNRETFSKYIYELHELVNKMLGKKSGLSYKDVRERYEHFRARCSLDKTKDLDIILQQNRTHIKKEKGCTVPLYGKKAKCVIHIVPQEKTVDTFQIDKECIKKRI